MTTSRFVELAFCFFLASREPLQYCLFLLSAIASAVKARLASSETDRHLQRRATRKMASTDGGGHFQLPATF
jgi:hypothetical protein